MLFFVALVCVEKPRFTQTFYRFSGCGARIIFPQFDTIIFSGYETLPEFTTRPDFLQRNRILTMKLTFWKKKFPTMLTVIKK
jgi:hypothetical protein